MKTTKLAQGRPLQAIVTKYISATSRTGARVKAVTESGESLTIPFQSSLSTPDAHAAAALLLAKKLGWKGRLVQGAIKGAGYAFVLLAR